MRTRRSTVAARTLLALLALSGAARAAGAEESCVFQSHSVDPQNPAPHQPFTFSVDVFAACFAFAPPVVAPGSITVDVECSCPIDPSPPPMLWTYTFEVPGLPAGPATVDFRHYSEPEVVYYSFALFVGSALHIPTLGAAGAALLAALLAAAAMASFRRTRQRVGPPSESAGTQRG